MSDNKIQQVVGANGEIMSLDKNKLTPKMVDIPGIPFKFAETCTTFDQYIQFCIDTGTSIPSDEGWGMGNRPVINISLLEICQYINWLNEKSAELEFAEYKEANPNATVNKLDAKYKEIQTLYAFRYVIKGTEIEIPDVNARGFRLPDSDSWIAAAGNVDQQAKEDLKSIAWYADNSNNQTHPVKELKPNNHGLYDMLGNTWEVCLNMES